MIGADVWNGTTAALNGFKNATGATYPLLLNSGVSAGGNFLSAYGDRDDYVVIDQQDIIRFNALTQGYSYGARYDLTRIRALVDSLLANAVGVGEPSRPLDARLVALPNPSSAEVIVRLARPGSRETAARVDVFDLSGRHVATLFDGEISGGAFELRWDGRDATGALAPAGVYIVRADAGDLHLRRRIVRLR